MAYVIWARVNYVGIRLFAGAPNPRWTESPAYFASVKTSILHLPPRTQAETYLVPSSGYGGVVVHLVEGDKRRLFVIHKEHVFDSETEVVRLDAHRSLERKLFETMPVPVVEMANRLSFQNAIVDLNEDKTIVGAIAGQAKPSCAGAHTHHQLPPKTKWDKPYGIADNNCYNYANNEFSTLDDAQPGRKAWTPVTEKEMHNLLVSDGLVPVSGNRKHLPSQCSTAAGAHLIAVCVRDPRGTKTENGTQKPLYYDYHCFRLDKSGGGRWSHKDGESPTTENDNRETGFPLNDLGNGIFKIEHVLVGYYWSIPAARNIGPPV